MKQVRRIIHVAAPAAFGGLERVVLALTRGQRTRGHDVSVAALHTSGAPAPPLLEDLRGAGIRVLPLAFKPRAYASQMRALSNLLADGKPDVIHAHGYHCDVLIAFLKTPTPIVTTVHGFTGGGLKTRFYEWVQVRAHRRFDAVVAVSRQIRTRLERCGVRAERIHVVRNAVIPRPAYDGDIRTELGIPPGAFSLGWIGRVSREKGLDVLIEGMPMLNDLPVRLTVVGEGPEVSRLRERSRTLGLEDRIMWLGMLPDAARLLSGFDTLILSSRTEGTPITLLEAMQARVPVVATSVGGIPEAITEREAMLVAPERPDLLAAAIRETVTDRRAAAKRAALARDRLDADFSMAAWLDAYDRVYHAARQDVKTGNS